MKERPILFSAPMIRAIGDGSKTQTRRIVKLPANAREIQYWAPPSGRSQEGWADPGVNYWTPDPSGETSSNHIDPCPYGQPGDRLWVRESFWGDSATKQFKWYVNDVFTPDRVRDCCRLVPSIHMRREYSRINLEITGVRVERLNDISEQDARAEGVDIAECFMEPVDKAGRVVFQRLWESINGAGSWDANPWVWVVEFRRLTA